MTGLGDHRRLQIGPFVIDLTTGKLFRDGHQVRIETKPFQFLELLLERPGEIVHREELHQKLWEGVNVGDRDRALNTVVMKARDALHDSAEKPMFVETIPGKGYRFIAPLHSTLETALKREPSTIDASTKIDVRGESVVQGSDGTEESATPSTSPRWRARFSLAQWVRVMFPIAVVVVVMFAARAGSDRFSVIMYEKPLTTNPDTRPVIAAAISPDGKYLVYAERDGVSLLDVTTRERTSVQPRLVGVTGLAWSRDSSSVLLSGHDYQSGQAVLLHLSILTRIARQLRTGVSLAAISPEGTRIAFIDESGRQVETMDVNGDESRTLLVGDEGDSFREIAWSPDGKRILLGRLHLAAFVVNITLESLAEEGHLTTILRSDPGLRSAVITRHGRLIYAAAEPSPGQEDVSLWESDHVDWESGFVSTPHRIARLPGTGVSGLSATADGSRLVLLKGPHQADVFVVDLKSRDVLAGSPRRLTVDQRNDLPTAWTSDSTAVIFHSDRRGKWEIYLQEDEKDQTTVLVSGPNDYRGARLSPNGQAVYYFERRNGNRTWQWLSPVKIMRAPLNGGPSQTILERRSASISFRCGRLPSQMCVVGERGWNSISFSAFGDVADPRNVRRLRSVATDAPLDRTNWDLSPDGARIALLLGDVSGAGRIRTLQLNDGSTRDITVKGLTGLQSIDWSADGRGWYVSAASARGARILYVSEDGEANVLRDQPQSFGTWAVPSPDGKHLAILEWSTATNAWMLETAGGADR